MNTRRDFIRDGFCAVAGSALAGCATRSAMKAPALAGDFVWGALLHLGTNMWGDWTPDKHCPRSAEEEARMVAEGKLVFETSRIYCCRDYFSTDWKSWNEQVDRTASEGLNAVFIDVGEAYAYPSHPELWVRGALSFDEMRAELARIRARGLEPIPKLNFSAGHDQWLREYHFMVSTPKYRQVAADVIADVCEVFGYPRHFHLGFDEEVTATCIGRQLCVMRHGDLWWKDFLSIVSEVERHGARAMMWSDKICDGREEFLKRMPRSVLQVPWYYGKDFSEARLKWDPSFERGKKWDRNMPAALVVLAENGYDLMPCTSNWCVDDAADVMLGFCKRRIDPARIQGYIVAPWRKAVPADTPKAVDGIRLFGAAKRRHFS